jgi:hypothetical protein
MIAIRDPIDAICSVEGVSNCIVISCVLNLVVNQT